MSIEARNISKTFGTFPALINVDLHVKSGELVALLGPSGSGKTTLLRIIAGLDSPDPGSGAVRFHDEDVTSRDAGKRKVGFVFQHYALFRHMTVAENVAFGLKVRPRVLRPSRAEIRERVSDLLHLVQIDSMADRYPSQLSGGQRQRVALARAMAVEPRVLLLDEPFGALDAKVRRELRRWLRKLHDESGITTLFVTHDQEEALEVADRIAVMNKARIEQVGTPEDVYEHPISPFVYDFLGKVNLFHGRVQDGRMKIGPSEFAAKASESQEGGSAIAFVRPHDVEVTRHANGSSIPVRVDHVSFAGPFVHVLLIRREGGDLIEAALPRERWREMELRPGEEVFATVKTARVFAEDYSI